MVDPVAFDVQSSLKGVVRVPVNGCNALGTGVLDLLVESHRDGVLVRLECLGVVISINWLKLIELSSGMSTWPPQAPSSFSSFRFAKLSSSLDARY